MEGIIQTKEAVTIHAMIICNEQLTLFYRFSIAFHNAVKVFKTAVLIRGDPLVKNVTSDLIIFHSITKVPIKEYKMTRGNHSSDCLLSSCSPSSSNKNQVSQVPPMRKRKTKTHLGAITQLQLQLKLGPTASSVDELIALVHFVHVVVGLTWGSFPDVNPPHNSLI